MFITLSKARPLPINTRYLDSRDAVQKDIRAHLQPRPGKTYRRLKVYTQSGRTPDRAWRFEIGLPLIAHDREDQTLIAPVDGGYDRVLITVANTLYQKVVAPAFDPHLLYALFLYGESEKDQAVLPQFHFLAERDQGYTQEDKEKLRKDADRVIRDLLKDQNSSGWVNADEAVWTLHQDPEL